MSRTKVPTGLGCVLASLWSVHLTSRRMLGSQLVSLVGAAAILLEAVSTTVP